MFYNDIYNNDERELFSNKELMEQYILWAKEQAEEQAKIQAYNAQIESEPADNFDFDIIEPPSIEDEWVQATLIDNEPLEPPAEWWEEKAKFDIAISSTESPIDLPNKSFNTPTITATIKKYLPVLHGRATDGMCFSMINKPIEKNIINDTGKLSTNFATLIIENFSKVDKKAVSTSTHKLLTYAISKFAEINCTGSRNNRLMYSTEVKIPLKEYAAYCGYNVEPHQTNTDEEKKIDKERIANTLRNARKKIRKDLDILFSAKLTWREKVESGEENFEDMRLIDYKSIENGYIKLNFSHMFAKRYLVRLPITQYPVGLLAIDERNNNAYAMGLKFAEHYNMNSQQGKSNAQALKVKTLLAVTTLPTIQKIRNQESSWRKRIKEPFEQSLDELYQRNVLADWKYAHSNGKSLTDEEASNWESFEQWQKTLICFSLCE